MQICLEVQDQIVEQLQKNWQNVPQRVLEILAVEAYKSQVLNSVEVGQLLNLSSRLEVDAFLKQYGAYLPYDETDFEQDLQTMRLLEQKEEIN